MRHTWKMGVFMVVMLLVGCQPLSSSMSEEPETQHTQNHHNGDQRETTASSQTLPSFLNQTDPQIAQIYQLVGQHPDVVKHMPCYCGCGDSAGHQSNLNCFIHEIQSDGSVVWDSHGMTCGVCLDIAAESIAFKQQGMELHEIRDRIDQRYKEGFGPPTPTPHPKG